MPGLWSATAAIFRKDIRAEMRSRELLSAMGLFSALCVLAFSFALELDRQSRDAVAGGVLWVTILFAVILGLNRSMGGEREQGNLDAMLLAPAPRVAIYFGKMLSIFVFSAAVGLALLPVMTVLYNLPLAHIAIVLAVVLGALALSAVGTLLAAMTVQTRARDSLLPIVMLPAALPVLMCAVRAANGLFANQPPSFWAGWLALLAVTAAAYTGLSAALFPFVLED
jgi:heme exporter protein B